jgi:hypothetical protein
MFMPSTKEHRMRNVRATAVACALMASAACMMQDQEAPPLAGPSGYGLSLSLTASPDTIQRDGASTSRIAVIARDDAGQPVQRQVILTSDSGRLSSASVTTTGDASNPAQVDFIAPGRNEAVDVVTITASVVGSDYANLRATTLNIRVIGPGVPVARFTITPETPIAGAQAVFDGTTSTVGFGAELVTWAWNFGDGTSAQGPVVSKTFDAAGTYPVTLTVIDNLGRMRATTIPVTVIAVEQ